MLTSAWRSGFLSVPSVPFRDTTQISRGKFDRLQHTTAGSTLCALDGCGLRSAVPARPALTPHTRFLSIGSCLCSTLLSDGSSRQPPLRFASPSVPSTWAKDFHLLAIEHARHTPRALGRPRPSAVRAGGRNLSPFLRECASQFLPQTHRPQNERSQYAPTPSQINLKNSSLRTPL